MAGKVFSSRDEDVSFDETLQDFVFLVHDVLGKDEDPADDTAELLLQLDFGLVEIAEKMQHADEVIAALSMDVISLTLHNSKMVHELREALKVMEALAMPANGEPFERALRILKREGDPDVSTASMNPDDPDEIEVRVQLTFTEDELAEALRLAIAEYNNETAAEALGM